MVKRIGSLRDGVGGLSMLWRQEPHLGIPGILAASILVLLPAYLALSALPAILAQPFIHDFEWFFEAAARFRFDAATTYDDPHFLYPPPSLLLFLPLTWLSVDGAYLLFAVGIVASVVASAWLSVRLYERSRGKRVGGAVLVTAVLIGLAFGSMLQTLKLGQVTALLLLLGLLLLWASAMRPGWAGVLLAAGFWLKLQPAALALLGLQPGRERRYLVGVGIGLIVLPLLLLPVIPLHLYEQYFFELLPQFSGLVGLAAENHSLAAVLERLSRPVDARLTTLHVPMTGSTRLVVLGYALVAFGAAYALFAVGGRRDAVPAGFIILAATPAVLPLGWEHAYLVALPLVLFLLLEARSRGIWVRAAAALSALMFLIPKPPDQLLAQLVTVVPKLPLELISARHLIATSLAIGLVVWWEAAALRNRRAPVRPAASPDPSSGHERAVPDVS